MSELSLTGETLVTLEVVKGAYQKRLLQKHPDKGGSKESFIQLQSAYHTVDEALHKYTVGFSVKLTGLRNEPLLNNHIGFVQGIMGTGRILVACQGRTLAVRSVNLLPAIGFTTSAYASASSFGGHAYSSASASGGHVYASAGSCGAASASAGASASANAGNARPGVSGWNGGHYSVMCRGCFRCDFFDSPDAASRAWGHRKGAKWWCPNCWERPCISPSPASTTRPQIALSTTAWTTEEISLAASLRQHLEGETAPVQGVHADIFLVAKLAVLDAQPLHAYPANVASLLTLARGFQLAIQQEKVSGRYLPLEAAIRREGAKGLNATVRAMAPGHTESEEWCIKTIGDVLQREVEKRHALMEGHARHELLSGFNVAQHQVALWLQLPRLAFSDDVAESVMPWNVHNMADLNEAFSLYLPAKLLDAYVRIQSHFHRFFLWTGPELCSKVDATRGICYKIRCIHSSTCSEHSYR